MSDVIVKYNNIAMSPTPTVSRSMQFIDYGTRWGQIEQIDLACTVTGASGTGAILQITSLFSGQFKDLEVFDGATSVYKWNNTVVQEVTFPKNAFFASSMVPYSVKLISYQVPSGVVEPTNEYSFTQGEDGLVSVNHKIAAKGVKTNSSAIDNAINFVKLFTNINPFTGCVPAFIPNGSGILLNVSETINRAEGYYGVNETYKFVTGSTQPYLQTTTLNIHDSSSEDYTTLDLNVRLQGSPVKNNLSDLQSSISSFSLSNALKDYGISSTSIYQNSFSVSQDSGAATVEFKASFISGVSNDFSGYFDYAVSLDEDIITNMATWRVDGEFICKGPLSFRRARIAAFKTANGIDTFIPYLKTLITSSALYANYGDFVLNPNPTQLTIAENTGAATLKLSATFNDADTVAPLLQPKYSIEVEPSKWIYELLPSANIEGHYTLQDLQMRNKAKIKLSMTSATSGDNVLALTGVSNVLSAISGIYVSNAFLMAESYNSGITSVGIDLEYLGKDTIGDTLSNTKVHGSFNNGYIRPRGYKFGY